MVELGPRNHYHIAGIGLRKLNSVIIGAGIDDQQMLWLHCLLPNG
jgi:hypothetical protein